MESKFDSTVNPEDLNIFIQRQKEIERCGRFVCIDDNTKIFVRFDVNEGIAKKRYLEKRNKRGIKNFSFGL